MTRDSRVLNKDTPGRVTIAGSADSFAPVGWAFGPPFRQRIHLAGRRATPGRPGRMECYSLGHLSRNSGTQQSARRSRSARSGRSREDHCVRRTGQNHPHRRRSSPVLDLRIVRGAAVRSRASRDSGTRRISGSSHSEEGFSQLLGGGAIRARQSLGVHIESHPD
jgi:hypothetical protein